MISIALLIANLIFSYKGFTSEIFFNRYKFDIDKILLNKEYFRLITSGFLHINWIHLIFNMMALYSFSGILELKIGSIYFLIIYFGSLLAGDLFSLFIHRNHGDYSAVGASGAVCGVIFASIALFPGLGIHLFGLPISIPSWLYGIVFVAFSIYGIKSNKDNIGHDAHLGGALIGMIIAIIIVPQSLLDNYLTILILTIPTLIFMYLVITKPQILIVDNPFSSNEKKYYNIDHKYNAEKVNKQKELDKLLEKIGQKGIDSLTAMEKQKLNDLSK